MNILVLWVYLMKHVLRFMIYILCSILCLKLNIMISLNVFDVIWVVNTLLINFVNYLPLMVLLINTDAPQQNEIVERKHCHILETTCSLLSASVRQWVKLWIMALWVWRGCWTIYILVKSGLVFMLLSYFYVYIFVVPCILKLSITTDIRNSIPLIFHVFSYFILLLSIVTYTLKLSQNKQTKVFQSH